MVKGLSSLPARYRVLRALGAGGMGAVYAAHDDRLGRDVAIKVLALEANPELRARFRREAATLARIRCPQVVEVYDFDPDAAAPWICMELLVGRDLRRDPPPDPLAAYREVAEGLAAVHSAGLVHRDVKPANILRTADGRVVLIDFGLVAGPAEAKLTATGQVVGTFHFMAPEVLQGATATPASDWYAWAVSVFVAFEGRVPFDIEDQRRIVRGEPLAPDFRILAPEGPLAGLLRRGMARDPARRPAGVGEIRRALAASAGGGAPPAPRAAAGRGGRTRGTEVLPAASLDAGPAAVPSGPPPTPGARSRSARALATWYLGAGALVALVAAFGAGVGRRPPLRRPAVPATPATPAETAPPAPHGDLAAELRAAARTAGFPAEYEARGVGAYLGLPGFKAAYQRASPAAPAVARRLRAADAAAFELDLVSPFGPGWYLREASAGWDEAFGHARTATSRFHERVETRAHVDPGSFPGASGDRFPILSPEARVLLAFGEARRGSAGVAPIDAEFALERAAWRRTAALGLRVVDTAPAPDRPARAAEIAAELYRTRTVTYGSLCGAAARQVVGAKPATPSGRFLALEIEEALAEVATHAGILPARDVLLRARGYAALAGDPAAPEALRRRAWILALRRLQAADLMAEFTRVERAGRGVLDAGLTDAERAWVAGVRARARVERAGP